MYFPNAVGRGIDSGMYGIGQQQQQLQQQGMYMMTQQQHMMPSLSPYTTMQQPSQYQFPSTTNPSPLFYNNPAAIQPYMDKQFLCKTFNFKVSYIQAFLSLTHQEKLKFFLIIESRRLTGQLTSKEEYNELLHKISSIVNPNYNQQKEQYKEVSEAEIKKKLLEREFQQKCEWQVRKLVQEENIGGKLSGNNEKEMSDFDWSSLGKISNSDIGNNNKMEKKVSQHGSILEDDSEFVYHQPTMNDKGQNDGNITQSSPLINQPFPTNAITPNDQQQWQQGLQLPNLQSRITNKTSAIYSKICYSQRKLDSIWDMQINEDEIRKHEPNIKEIFGVKGQEDEGEEEFGGFEEGKDDVNDVVENDHDFKKDSDNMNGELINITIDPINSFQNAINSMKDNNNMIDFYKRPSPQKDSTYYRDSTITETSTTPHNNISNWLTTTQSSQTITNHPQYQQSLTYHPQLFQLQQHQEGNGSLSSVSYVKSGQMISSVNIDMDMDLIGGSSENVYQWNSGVRRKNNRDDGGYNNNVMSENIIFDLGQLDEMGLFGATKSSNVKVDKQNEVQQQQQYQQPATNNYEDNVNAQLYLQATYQPTPANLPTQQWSFSQNKVEERRNESHVMIEDIVTNKQQQDKHADQQQDEWEVGEEIMPEEYQSVQQGYRQQHQQQQQYHQQQEQYPQQQGQQEQFQQYQKQQQKQGEVNDNNNSNTQTYENNNFLDYQYFSASNNNSMPKQQQQQFAFTDLICNNNNSNLYSQHYQQFNNQHQTQSQDIPQQKPTKIIRKIAKPPESNINQQSNFNKKINQTNNHFEVIIPQHSNNNNKNQQQQQHQIIRQQQLEVIRKPQKRRLTHISSVNIAINVSGMLSQRGSKREQFMMSPKANGSSSYEQSKQQQQHSISLNASCMFPIQRREQKIISTYNKPMSYTPNSLSVSLLAKPKLFFKSKSKSSSSSTNHILSNQVNNYSNGVQVDDDNNNLNVDHSLQEQNGRYNFRKKQSIEENDNNKNINTEQQKQQHYQQYQHEQSTNSMNEKQLIKQLFTKASHQLIYKLPQSQVRFVRQELVKNKFFFDKVFYIQLRQLLEKLAMKEDVKEYCRGLVKGKGYGYGANQQKSKSKQHHQQQQSTLFQQQIRFLTQILSKLNQIDQLNKQFTVAVEDDQQEQLAEVIFKSKQLTYEVSEDGEVAKKIAGLMVQGRDNSGKIMKKQLDQDNYNEEIEKYKGVYYLLVKLLITPSSKENHIDNNYATTKPIPQLHLTHLLQTFTTIPSPLTLQNKSPFLLQLITLYILHNHLNQLQYIKNISHTIFSYLIKQHAVLIQKINEIKRLSIKYGQMPQGIFAKLMQSQRMVGYLKGLGEMAGVAERVLQVVRRIGVSFNIQTDADQFQQNKLRKIITQCRQLAVKYNLLQTKSSASSTNILPNDNHLLRYGVYLREFIISAVQERSIEETYKGMNELLRERPVCKVCMMPKCSDGEQKQQQQGDFIADAMLVSQQSIGSHSNIEWCHYTCYNMLKMAFEDLADSSMMHSSS